MPVLAQKINKLPSEKIKTSLIESQSKKDCNKTRHVMGLAIILDNLIRSRLNCSFKIFLQKRRRFIGILRYFTQFVVVHGKRKFVDKMYRNMVKVNKQKNTSKPTKLQTNLQINENERKQLERFKKIFLNRIKKGLQLLSSIQPKRKILMQKIFIIRMKQLKPLVIDMNMFEKVSKISQFLNKKILSSYSSALAAISTNDDNILSFQVLSLLKTNKFIDTKGIIMTQNLIKDDSQMQFSSDLDSQTD